MYSLKLILESKPIIIGSKEQVIPNVDRRNGLNDKLIVRLDIKNPFSYNLVIRL